eukprot:TRINITY_DN19146_c0_g1_i1.p1 TRINITY_DN19146_c0_g1~~TRINITY_DN19146_c0_g1_i1.p1  ORF type:complete len:343 (+),score=49.47 TRINITY_DN19146_c0_g1_i1:126-1154(+)
MEAVCQELLACPLSHAQRCSREGTSDHPATSSARLALPVSSYASGAHRRSVFSSRVQICRPAFGGCDLSQLRRSCCAGQPQPRRQHSRVPEASASAAADDLPTAGGAGEDEDPWQVLGVNPLRGFDAAMTAHKKMRNEANRRGDTATMDRADRAYNSIMMRQFSLRKQGLTTGSFEVSKEIKYADKRALFPWLPRRAPPLGKQDQLINAALAAVPVIWVLVAGVGEWKPLQVALFAFFGRIFIKLQALAKAPPSFAEAEGEGEEGGGGAAASSARDDWNRGVLLRSAGLVFGSLVLGTMTYFLLLQGFLLVGEYPMFLANGQERIVTGVATAALYLAATFYR